MLQPCSADTLYKISIISDEDAEISPRSQDGVPRYPPGGLDYGSALAAAAAGGGEGDAAALVRGVLGMGPSSSLAEAARLATQPMTVSSLGSGDSGGAASNGIGGSAGSSVGLVTPLTGLSALGSLDAELGTTDSNVTAV